MKRTKAELRARVNQMFKEQVVPEYATRDLADGYGHLMSDVEYIFSHDVMDNADEIVIAQAQKVLDKEYNNRLNPATALIGEGATVCYYTDSEAYTIIDKSKTGKKLTLRRCNATLASNFQPKLIRGGFVGHCINNHEQTYTYEEDPEGEVITASWSDKKRGYYSHGLHIVKGRHEFYDYNF